MNRSYKILASDSKLTAEEATASLRVRYYELLGSTITTHIAQPQSPIVFFPGKTELGEKGCFAVQAFMLHPFPPEMIHATR